MEVTISEIQSIALERCVERLGKCTERSSQEGFLETWVALFSGSGGKNFLASRFAQVFREKPQIGPYT